MGRVDTAALHEREWRLDRGEAHRLAAGISRPRGIVAENHGEDRGKLIASN